MRIPNSHLGFKISQYIGMDTIRYHKRLPNQEEELLWMPQSLYYLLI
jgi:hypothetical protein